MHKCHPQQKVTQNLAPLTFTTSFHVFILPTPHIFCFRKYTLLPVSLHVQTELGKFDTKQTLSFRRTFWDVGRGYVSDKLPELC